MKLILLIAVLACCSQLQAQNLEGAWKLTHQNGEAITDREYIKIYQDGYFAFGAKEIAGNKFLYAGGGPFDLDQTTYTEQLDFLTLDPE